MQFINPVSVGEKCKRNACIASKKNTAREIRCSAQHSTMCIRSKAAQRSQKDTFNDHYGVLLKKRRCSIPEQEASPTHLICKFHHLITTYESLPGNSWEHFNNERNFNGESSHFLSELITKIFTILSHWKKVMTLRNGWQQFKGCHYDRIIEREGKAWLIW